jgi:hypothetical protein
MENSRIYTKAPNHAALVSGDSLARFPLRMRTSSEIHNFSVPSLTLSHEYSSSKDSVLRLQKVRTLLPDANIITFNGPAASSGNWLQGRFRALALWFGLWTLSGDDVQGKEDFSSPGSALSWSFCISGMNVLCVCRFSYCTGSAVQNTEALESYSGSWLVYQVFCLRLFVAF